MIDYSEGTGKQYHTQVGKGDVGKYVILPGDPICAEKLYDRFISILSESVPKIQHGVFGADMKVELVNDGPFTIILDDHQLKLD